MKKFVYQVDGFEFVDTVAFGEAWKEAKMEAAALHVPIIISEREKKTKKEMQIMSIEYYEIHAVEYEAMLQYEEELLMDADYEASDGHLWD